MHPAGDGDWARLTAPLHGLIIIHTVLRVPVLDHVALQRRKRRDQQRQPGRTPPALIRTENQLFAHLRVKIPDENSARLRFLLPCLFRGVPPDGLQQLQGLPDLLVIILRREQIS